MGAVWQFYYKEIFNGYKQDDTLRATLENTYKQLTETFQGYKPDLLIEERQSKIQPWRNAREDRGKYFNFGDWYDIQETPEEARMLKFWYADVTNKMLAEFYAKVYERFGSYDRFPQDISALMGVAKESDWAGRDVSLEEVQLNLQLLSWGFSLSSFLLDSKVSSVSAIVPWPRRRPTFYGEMLRFQTVGLRFTITTRDLVRMLENLRQESRFFTVDSLRITYPYIAYAVEPQLDVRMLLSQADYVKQKDEEPGAATLGTPGAPGAPGMPGRPLLAGNIPVREQKSTPAVEPSAIYRFWVWFRRNVLYIP
jgi:hypothetical protein